MADLKKTSRARAALLLAAAIAVAALASGLIVMLRPADTAFTLPAVEADVAKRFQEVAQISTDDLTAKMKTEKPPMLFDVREDAEYRVSHLSGAERVDPGLATADFLARYASSAVGRDVVFYCSVGMRSSGLAAEVQEGLVKAGALSVSNLRGGLFGWHNERRPLVDTSGPTDGVHPYNAKWGTLIDRQAEVRMQPAQ